MARQEDVRLVPGHTALQTDQVKHRKVAALRTQKHRIRFNFTSRNISVKPFFLYRNHDYLSVLAGKNKQIPGRERAKFFPILKL